MYRVIVLSGIALTAGVGCGATATGADAGDSAVVAADAQADSPGDAIFPHEGPVMLDAAQPDDGAIFPHEGPVMLDAAQPDDAVDAASDAAAPDAGCLPRETAIAWDC